MTAEMSKEPAFAGAGISRECEQVLDKVRTQHQSRLQHSRRDCMRAVRRRDRRARCAERDRDAAEAINVKTAQPDQRCSVRGFELVAAAKGGETAAETFDVTIGLNAVTRCLERMAEVSGSR
eukprot:SAG31_NODE_1045_length_10180_cov_5.454221_4_plen_122_part_00